MGNPKFKLSDMIPNAWFYKLRDTNNKPSKPLSSSSKLKKHRLPPPPAPPSSPPTSTVKTPPFLPNLEPQCQPRQSYHITRELTSPPPRDLDSVLPFTPPRKSKSSTKSRKSSKRSDSLSSSCSCKSAVSSKSYSPPPPPPVKETNGSVGFFVEDALLKTDYPAKQSILDRDALPKAEHQFDIIIDVDKQSMRNENKKFNLQLRPIITKPEAKPRNFINENKQIKEQRYSKPRISVSSPGGVRLRVNSPRVLGRKQGQNGNSTGRRSTSSSKKKTNISESFAVVKSSYDPQRDFKESMVEMIVQNNLKNSKDLEDLLACYLSLNSDEYHEVIIKVFKQLWFDFRHNK